MLINVIACLAIGQSPVWAITDKEVIVTVAPKPACACGVNCPCKAKPAPQTTNAVVRPTNSVVVRPVAAPVVIRQSTGACYIDAQGRKVCPLQR